MDSRDYRAFLLRLWREGEGLPWRATLEDPHTGERFNFATLERLFEFLTATGAPPDFRDRLHDSR